MSKFKEYINSNTPTILHLTAEWATPSVILTETLKGVKKELGNEVNVLKIDADKNEKIAQKFNVVGLPEIIIYKSGKIIWRSKGLSEQEEILNQIKNV